MFHMRAWLSGPGGVAGVEGGGGWTGGGVWLWFSDINFLSWVACSIRRFNSTRKNDFYRKISLRLGGFALKFLRACD
jgi:hypothetical protein